MPTADRLRVMAPAGPRVIWVDVGGTAMKAVLLEENGALVPLLGAPTPRSAGPEAVVDAVLATVDRVAAGVGGFDTLAGIGLVVPGFVDEASGVAEYSENIGWRDVPFRDLVTARTGRPVAVGHDVRAGGLAERSLGAAAGARDALFLAVGTGVAGALVVEGRALQGTAVGELGHVDVGSGLPCACGGRGCLETVATGPAMTMAYAARTGLTVAGAKDVFAAAARGDHVAQEVVDGAVDALARVLATYVTILAPEVIVVGGGLALAGDQLLVPLAGRLGESLPWQRPPRLVQATFGDQAAAVGTTLLARAALEPTIPQERA